jgi:hypothetical protein
VAAIVQMSREATGAAIDAWERGAGFTSFSVHDSDDSVGTCESNSLGDVCDVGNGDFMAF